MQPDLRIRHATPADAPALAQLAADAFRDTHRPLDDPNEIEDYVAANFRVSVVAASIEDPSSRVLLALSPTVLVGYAHLKLSQAPPCVSGPAPVELARLYLAQPAIGKGVGAQLMRAVQAEARQLDRQTLWLSVYDKNVRAVQFYKKFGFVEVGGREFLFGGRVYVDPVMSASL
jgi:GNAT superfamily N-acetyltransferase